MNNISNSKSISFGKIEHFLLIGGGFDLFEFAVYLMQKEKRITVFSGKRHLDEEINDKGETLEQLLDKNSIEHSSPDDINNDKVFLDAGASNAIGLGFGETWIFTKQTIELFGGRLLDIMRIPLPHYRGGAHFTWQILRKNRVGACHLQMINEDMVQGEFDSGELIKSSEHLFSTNARIPKDYFREAHDHEIQFLKEFVEELESGKEFLLTPVPDQFSIYFPRLHTKSQAFIDWSWQTEDIESFICAFDDPYPGSSTFINNNRVFLKQARIEYNDGPFHPFQRGLIYRTNSNGIYIATKNGTLIVQKVLDEKGDDIISTLRTGNRFHTPQSNLDEAQKFQAAYDSEGLKAK